jgi:hypothetical protein
MLGITSPVAAKEGLLSVVVSNLILRKRFCNNSML